MDPQNEYFLSGVTKSRIVNSHSKPVKSSRSNFHPAVRKQKSSLTVNWSWTKQL